MIEAGAAVKGTVLLVPGFTGSKEDFIALHEPLAEAGYRSVAVDGRGQHESPGAEEDEAPYAQAELAKDLLAQAEAVSDGTPCISSATPSAVRSPAPPCCWTPPRSPRSPSWLPAPPGSRAASSSA